MRRSVDDLRWADLHQFVIVDGMPGVGRFRGRCACHAGHMENLFDVAGPSQEGPMPDRATGCSERDQLSRGLTDIAVPSVPYGMLLQPVVINLDHEHGITPFLPFTVPVLLSYAKTKTPHFWGVFMCRSCERTT